MNSFISRLVIACLLLLSFNTNANAENCKILVFGDSLSAAYGISTEQGWVSLMNTRLQENQYSCEVVNASISGETTAGGKTRLPKAIEKHQPTLVILELGANDGLRGLALKNMQDNLQSMIDMTNERNVVILLVGMQIPPNYGFSYAKRFTETYKTLADENDIALVPFMLNGFALDRGMFLSDGIHPNEQAQYLILDTIWQELEPLLNEEKSDSWW